MKLCSKDQKFLIEEGLATVRNFFIQTKQRESAYAVATKFSQELEKKLGINAKFTQWEKIELIKFL